MKFICTLLLSLFLLPAFAQTTTTAENDSVYVADYYKLRELYLKYIDAKKGNKADKLMKEFVLKAKFGGEFKDLNPEEGIIGWVRQNIEKTSFKNVAEAEKLWNEAEAAGQVKPQEQIAYEEEEKKMSDKHGRKIVIDVRLNRGAGGRNPKEEPDYIAAYEKLKSLTIEHEKSEDYKNVRALEKAYYKKANFDFKKDKYTYPETIYDWVKKNLSRTMFTSLTQAQLEWNKIEDAKKAEEKKNAEYYDFMDECLSKYGPYIHTDAMMETMFSKD
jgi:hypothetical protein